MHAQLTHEHPVSVKSHEKVTLAKFWKEIIFICMITSVLFHLSICRLSANRQDKDHAVTTDMAVSHESLKAEMSLVGEESMAEHGVKSPVRPDSPVSAQGTAANLAEQDEEAAAAAVVYPVEVKSRFFDDFNFNSLLGKGGFGVVYSCKHVIDHKDYAIKQINLPDRKIDQEKLFREVHALAYLDHPNILRYYQSWIEQPPRDWYEKKAKEVFMSK